MARGNSVDKPPRGRVLGNQNAKIRFGRPMPCRGEKIALQFLPQKFAEFGARFWLSTLSPSALSTDCGSKMPDTACVLGLLPKYPQSYPQKRWGKSGWDFDGRRADFRGAGYKTPNNIITQKGPKIYDFRREDIKKPSPSNRGKVSPDRVTNEGVFLVSLPRAPRNSA